MDLIIVDDFSGSPIQRLKNLDFPPGYEVIPLTLNEIMQMKKKNNKLISDAFKYGVLLRDDFNILEMV